MRISDWSSDVCSSDLCVRHELHTVYEISTPSPSHCSDPSRPTQLEPMWSYLASAVVHMTGSSVTNLQRPTLSHCRPFRLLWLHNQHPFLTASESSPCWEVWRSATARKSVV